MKFHQAFAALCFVAVGVGPAWAETNLVQDPGFESLTTGGNPYQTAPKTLSDGFWMQTEGQGLKGYSAAGFNAYAGNHWYGLSPSGTFSTLEQVLQTTPGQSYSLTCYLSLTSGVTISFGGLPVNFTQSSSPIVGTGGVGYYEVTATGLIATGSSTALDFSSSNANSLLDEVSVTASAAVPEPTSLSLLALGGMAVRRRRR